jgi:hypothetical protein
MSDRDRTNSVFVVLDSSFSAPSTTVDIVNVLSVASFFSFFRKYRMHVWKGMNIIISCRIVSVSEIKESNNDEEMESS